jgi:cytochrome b
VRTIHWLAVAGVAVAWVVSTGSVHDAAGYFVLALFVFRILWGFVGPGYARFGNFIKSPRSVLQYVQALRAGNEPRCVGHNPLGGWMILALLGAGVATALSGWLYTTDAFWGVAWVEAIHVFFADAILVLAAVHVAGVLFTSVRQRENLVASMFHGRKRAL